MIPSLWIAKTGLDAQQTNMDVIANNLANVSTNGFKRQRAVFEDLLYQTMRQPVATERLHSQGNLSQTNNSKDVAIKGQGFFQVLLPDGSQAYTRDGSFQIDQNGQLVTASGFQVQPTLLAAQKDPDKYRNLVVRVAGYCAYFTDLSEKLQMEIINRTEHTSMCTE